MALNSIEELVEDIRQGKMVILMDDEDRENEGDLIMAASKVRPEDVNFMVRHACGLVCLTLTEARAQRLRLGPMVSDNRTAHATNFTASIEAAEGVTTGISAADRARTIQVAVAADAVPEDLVQPGHIFPLVAREGGVLSRAGHTEAGCDLARLAGLEPAAVIVEIMNEDGSMARRPQLEQFAATHNLKIGTIASLIHYRILHEKTIIRLGSREVMTRHGPFTLVSYRDTLQGDIHLALVCGEIDPDQPVLVRVQQADRLRDLLQIASSTASWSVHDALAAIAAAGQGVLVLIAGNEPPDATLASLARLEAVPQRRRVEQNPNVFYTVGTGSQILRDLGVRQMRLMSSPIKYNAISGFDLTVVEYLAADGRSIHLE